MTDKPDWYGPHEWSSTQQPKSQPWKWAFGDYVAVVILVGFVLNHIF